MTRQPSRYPSFAELHDPAMQCIVRELEEERHIRESVEDECAERECEMEDEE